jgi:hypothetical protein
MEIYKCCLKYVPKFQGSKSFTQFLIVLIQDKFVLSFKLWIFMLVSITVEQKLSKTQWTWNSICVCSRLTSESQRDVKNTLLVYVVAEMAEGWIREPLSKSDPGEGKVKVKVKLSLCLSKHHAMKAYWVSGGIIPRVVNVGTRWKWVVSCTPGPLYSPGKGRLYPLDKRLSGTQSRSGRGAEEKKIISLPLPGIEPRSSIPYPVTLLTDLPRFVFYLAEVYAAVTEDLRDFPQPLQADRRVVACNRRSTLWRPSQQPAYNMLPRPHGNQQDNQIAQGNKLLAGAWPWSHITSWFGQLRYATK